MDDRDRLMEGLDGDRQEPLPKGSRTFTERSGLAVLRNTVPADLTGKLVVLMVSTILVLSAVDKILHYEGFLAALQDYVVLPLWSARFLGIPLIAVELAVGIGLMFRPWRRESGVAGGILFLLFAGVLAANYMLGGRGMCGCWFTITLAQGTEAHIAQNLMLAILSFSLTWRPERRQRLSPSKR